MSTNKFKGAFRRYNQSVTKESTILLGDLGTWIDGKKVVSVPGRPQFVYVRLRTKLSELVPAFNDKVAQKYGVPVKLKREGNLYVVIGRNNEAYTDWENNDPYIPKHAAEHIFDKDGQNVGGDVVWVYPYQFMPSLVSPFGARGATNVFVNPYPLRDLDGSWKYCGNTGTERLTKYNPASGTSLVLVTLDTVSGNPTCFATTGTYIPSGVTGVAQMLGYLPEIENTYIPETIVRLVSGTVSIGWNQLYDVRQFLEPIPYPLIVDGQETREISVEGASIAHTGTSVFLDIVGGGGGGVGGIVIAAEGRLVSGTNIAEPYMVTAPMDIDKVYLYCETLGVTGTTVIDVLKNGESLFSGSERLELPYTFTGTYTSRTPYVQSLEVGDIITLNSEGLAVPVENLQLAIVPSGGSGGSLTVTDGSITVAGVDKLTFEGVSVSDEGGGEAKIIVNIPTSFPNYASGVSKSSGVVYQADSDGWLNVVMSGSYMNYGRVLVGAVNPPATIVAHSGDDLNSYTKHTSWMLPIPKDTFYMVENTSWETMTIVFYPTG